MSGTAVPGIVFGPLGAVAPPESAIVTGLDADWNAAFGGGLNTNPPEPAGQLIASEAAIIGNNNDDLLFIFNNVDPAYASGRMQDAIARIYFIERLPSQPTVLQITCGGLQNVIIPANALISDGLGNLYFNAAQAIIGLGGTVTAEFNAVVNGPTSVPASVSIYQSQPGWNTVSVSSGVVGQLTETRAAFELRRELTVAANGQAAVQNVLGALLGGGANGMGVAGVIDAYVTDNSTGSPATTGGVVLNPNSLYVCVAGGASADVAQAIWIKKNPGCAYTGNTTVVVTDSNSGYSLPYPTYNVVFEIPIAAPIAFNVVLANNSGVPSNAQALVAAAIQLGFSGQDGGTRARIGSTLYASRYYGDVAALGSWVQIVDIQIGTQALPTATFTGSIAGTALTVLAATVSSGTYNSGSGAVALTTSVTHGLVPGNSFVVHLTGTGSITALSGRFIATAGTTGSTLNYTAATGLTVAISGGSFISGALAIGQFVYGSAVLPGTIITSGSGTSWVVSNNQTVTIEAMQAVAATNNSVAMQINWLPALANADINVTLT